MSRLYRTDMEYVGDDDLTEIVDHDPRAGEAIGIAIALTGWDDNGPEYGDHVAQLLARGGWVLVRPDASTTRAS